MKIKFNKGNKQIPPTLSTIKLTVSVYLLCLGFLIGSVGFSAYFIIDHTQTHGF